MLDPKTRVLIVDDMSSMRKVIAKSCKEMGFVDIAEAADGALAWEALKAAATPFDIVVSDWNMPTMTGIELLKKCREDAQYGKVPFVMVTAETEPHQLAEAIKLNVDAYVQKPVKAVDFKTKLEAVLVKKGFFKKAA